VTGASWVAMGGTRHALVNDLDPTLVYAEYYRHHDGTWRVNVTFLYQDLVVGDEPAAISAAESQLDDTYTLLAGIFP
jgi:hypothetical protein